MNGRARWRKSSLVFNAAICLGAIAQIAHATDYSMGAGVNVRAKHDDNIRLVSSNETAIAGIVASPSVNLKANSETSAFGLNTSMSLSRYNDSGFDSNDINTNASWARQFETSSIGIDLTAIRDSTTTSEIRDSGRVGSQADRHEHYAITPTGSYALTEVDSLGFTASASKDIYANDSYQGYRNASTAIDWTHVLNDRWRTIVRATYSDYQSDDRIQTVPVYFILNPDSSPVYIPIGSGEQSNSTRSRSIGSLLGGVYQLSEQNSLTFLTGLSRVTTQYSLQDPEQICGDANLFSPLCDQATDRGNSLNVEVDWNWTGERNSTAMTISKMDRPSSDGYPLDSWQADANWNYRLSETSRLSSTLSWGRNRISASGNNTAISQSSNRDYGDAGISYSQDLSEYWRVSAGFQWRYQNYTELSDAADSRVISLAISYQPQTKHWSR